MSRDFMNDEKFWDDYAKTITECQETCWKT